MRKKDWKLAYDIFQGHLASQKHREKSNSDNQTHMVKPQVICPFAGSPMHAYGVD